MRKTRKFCPGVPPGPGRARATGNGLLLFWKCAPCSSAINVGSKTTNAASPNSGLCGKQASRPTMPGGI